MRTRIHETNRQCGGAGSPPPSSRGSPTGREEQHGSRATHRRRCVERQALETRMVPGRRRRLECQAESRSSATADPRTIASFVVVGAGRRPSGRLSHRSVDVPPSGPGNPRSLWGDVPSRPRGPHPACVGVLAAEAAAAGQAARRSGDREVAEARLADDQKKGRRTQAVIVFLDETGFLLQPLNRRTWALRGETPIQYASARHDRLSVIGAVTLSPQRRRISTYWQFYDGNIVATDAGRLRHARQSGITGSSRFAVIADQRGW
jgi:hypothetical protein